MLFNPVLTRRWTAVEAIAICAAAAATAASLIAAPNAAGVVGAGLALLMTAIAATDARYFIIPDGLNAAALGLALVHAAIRYPQAPVEAVNLAILRGAVLALVFLGLRIAYRQLRGREGLGLGDVKLAGVAGIWLDWLMIPAAVEIAAIAGIAVYAARMHRAGRSLALTSRLPFGLFFAPAIWLGW